MHRYRANSFLTVLLIIIAIKAGGQTSTVSNPLSEHENNPYSRYGIGTLSNSDNVVLQGMGNISSAYENPYEMNTDNPASYSSLRFTTYEGGLYGIARTIATNDLSYQTGTATISYMNIGVPLGKKAGLCIGIRPVSSMFYNLADTSVTAIGNTQGIYTGSGSVNLLYIGGAYKIKSFSFGINAGYMFGQLSNTLLLNNIDTINNKSYSSDFSRYTKIGGIYWKAGVMYEHDLKKDLTLRAGGTFAMQQNLNVSQGAYSIGTYGLVDTFIQDTAYSAPAINGKIVMPMSFSLGVQLLSTDKWLIGVDYMATKWTQYRFLGSADSLADAYKISIGGEFTPNSTSLRNYWARATYRAGLYYGKDPVYLQNTSLMFYGFTAGASLPIKRSTSHLHLGIDVGSLGTKSNNLIKETYVRFSVGFSFNDRWFVKRRYD